MSWLGHCIQRCRADHRVAGITLFGAVACSGILPFMAWRAVQGEWLRAGIDAALVLTILVGVLWTWRTGRHAAASVVAVGVSLGVVGVAATGALEGVLWTYPAVAAIFMLAPRWICVACVAAMLVALALMPPSTGLPALPASFYATTVLVAVFGFVAATLTGQHRRQLEQLARRDPLTGIANRRTMELELAEAVAQHHAGGLPAGLAVLDLDHFKQVNDAFGHAAGDHVLVDFSRIVQGCIRLRDRLYRLGGEEFVLLLPGTDEAGVESALAKVHAELRQRLRGPGGAVRTSMGAALLRPGDDWRSWLARADAALYGAKHAGRDRIVIDHPAPAGRRSPTPQFARA